MKSEDRPIRNPFVVLREEFDDWAVLFNPDARPGFIGFGLNPLGVYIWKLLDGEHTIDYLVERLHQHAVSVPDNAREHINMFIETLVAHGLTASGDPGFVTEKPPRAPDGPCESVKGVSYEPPTLINLGSGQAAHGDYCATHGSQVGVDCSTGNAAAHNCCTGSCATCPSCSTGSCDGVACAAGGNPLNYPCGWGSTNPVMCSCYAYGSNATSCISNGVSVGPY